MKNRLFHIGVCTMQHKGRIIKLHYMTLPSGIHGAVREMEHSYVILINSDSPGIMQRFAIGHEFAHIFLDHFESSKGVLAFYSWSIEDDASVSIHEITVLLHEMIHQYCRQEGIVDMDSNGEHNSTFSEVAEKHGLNRYGYQLQSQLEDEIDAELDWFRNWEY